MAGQNNSSRDAVRRAKSDVAETIALAVKHTRRVLEGLTDAELDAGFRESNKDAPAFTHLVRALAQSQIKAEQAQGPTVQNNLNLVIVPTAKSNESWLEDTKQFRQLPPGAQKAIDVVPLPATKAKK